MANYNNKIINSNLNLMVRGLGLQSEEEPLKSFPHLNIFERNIMLLLPSIQKRIYVGKGIHGFKVNRDNKTYYFQTFTNRRMSKFDIKRIKSSSLNINELIYKVLEIVGSHQLLEPLFIFGKTDDEIKFLAEFSKNGKRYIIDINYDIIMESNNYRELKNLQVIKTLDINQVYFMDKLIKELDAKISVIFFIMFYDEVMPYFMNMLGYKFEGYDSNGINYHNANMFYSSCDTIFKVMNNSEALPEFDDINNITMNPKRYNFFSTFDGGYLFKKYPFKLYSNVIEDEEVKRCLLSYERFGLCHYQSPRTALSLKKILKNRKVNIVSGRCFYKTKRYIYHTWVEFESSTPDKYYVVDFTQNLIMERSKFYEYAQVQILECVDVNDFIRLQRLLREYNIRIEHRLRDIFATELLRDLERNKKILTRN